MPDTVTDAFECFEPDAATLAAIAEAALGNLVTTHSVAEFMAELNQDRHGDDDDPP